MRIWPCFRVPLFSLGNAAAGETLGSDSNVWIVSKGRASRRACSVHGSADAIRCKVSRETSPVRMIVGNDAP